MDAIISDRHAEVTLSRRNLEALLSKLDMPGSARTIERRLDDRKILIVRAEENDQHYTDRVPGQMHPRTEEEIT